MKTLNRPTLEPAMPTNEGLRFRGIHLTWFAERGLEDDDYTAALGALGRRVPIPGRSWSSRATAAALADPRHGVEAGGILHDFGGFRRSFMRSTIRLQAIPSWRGKSPGSWRAKGWMPSWNRGRGLDHGAWVPLRLAWPRRHPGSPAPARRSRYSRAAIPTGRALRPLRTREILIVGSGGVVHNLGLVRFQDESAPVDDWAAAFDQWSSNGWPRATRTRCWAIEASRHARLAVPTTEHFDPLFCAAGAAFDGERATGIYEGFRYGNLSMRELPVLGPAERTAAGRFQPAYRR